MKRINPEVSNDRYSEFDFEVSRQRFVAKALLFLAFPTITYLIIRDCFIEKRGPDYPVFVMFIILIGLSFVVLKPIDDRKKYTANRIWLTLFIVLLGMNLVYEILVERKFFSTYWSYVFPMLVFFGMGLKEGLILTLVFFSTIAFSLFYSDFQPILLGELKIRFLISLLLISIMSFLSAYAVRRDQKRLANNHLILKNEMEEREEAEHALQESEERYRSLVDGARDVIFTLSPTGTITSLNPAFETILGWSRNDWIGKPFSPILHPDDLPSGTDLFQKVLNGETPPVRELRVRMKSGEFRIGEFVANPQIQDRRVVGFLGVARNITERKHAEAALQESLSLVGRSKREWESTVDSLPQLICVLDHGGTVLRTNRTVERWNIEQVTNVKGRRIHQLLHPDCKDPSCYLETFWPQAWKELTSGRSTVSEAEDGMLNRYLHIQARPIAPHTYRKGEATDSFAVVVLNDITEQKQAERNITALEEQLRHSQKIEAIGRLAGGVAHDFNNLMTVIKGYSQLTLLDCKEDNELMENLLEIQKASLRAEDLTRQLLAFTRHQIMDMKVLDLNTLLQDLDKMLRRVIGEDIELIPVLAGDLGRVKTDPGQIEQVLLNLVINARDAMPKGGKLIIETRNVELDEGYGLSRVGVIPGPYVMLSMRDTGCGMSPEVKEQIFEPFFTTKEIGKGTGLGLSTVYGIVKQSGGNIWVYSELGKGTTFKIYLPRVDETLNEIIEKGATEETLRGSETILTVEDDGMVRKLAAHILKTHGYKVFEASHGEEALKVAKEHATDRIHLLLTDVVMPGISGPELSKGLISLHPEMQVIYMSGYTDNAILYHGVLEQGVDYIQKPFTPDSLARKVREVLDRKVKGHE